MRHLGFQERGESQKKKEGGGMTPLINYVEAVVELWKLGVRTRMHTHTHMYSEKSLSRDRQEYITKGNDGIKKI